MSENNRNFTDGDLLIYDKFFEKFKQNVKENPSLYSNHFIEYLLWIEDIIKNGFSDKYNCFYLKAKKSLLITLIDKEDFVSLKDKKWGFYGNYFLNTSSKTPLHREIYSKYQDIKDKYIDHINLNKFDNRKENLRVVSQKENVRHRFKSKNNKSGYKGVSKSRGGNWTAKICVDYKSIQIGTFKTKEEAATAYDLHSTSLFKEFGVKNFNDLSEDILKSVKERLKSSEIKKRIDSSSKHYGVFYYPSLKKWRAKIKINKKEIHIGYFLTEDGAKNAVDTYIKQYEKI